MGDGDDFKRKAALRAPLLMEQLGRGEAAVNEATMQRSMTMPSGR